MFCQKNAFLPSLHIKKSMFRQKALFVMKIAPKSRLFVNKTLFVIKITPKSVFFNQQLDLPLSGGKSVFDLTSTEDVRDARITFDNHCYGCTAGMGSS